MIRLAIGIFAWFYVIFPVGIVQADSGWTDYGYVVELNPTSQYYYSVQLDVKQNPSGCKKKKWFYQDSKIPGANKMFLILLDALKENMRVRVYVTGGCNLHGHSAFSSVSVIRK
jgi:hypothetical protein